MKCQECGKPATMHITELSGGEVTGEAHLCEDHAREYLTQMAAEASSSSGGGGGKLMSVEEAAEQLEQLTDATCPVCGVSFGEFRSTGRLGCPHDYVCFQKLLEPLLVSIHGESAHTGKSPIHTAEDSTARTELIRLRREMKEAIAEEDYERASEIRDRIRRIEDAEPA